jgi:phosphoribosylformylglycinamidine cyclo-ligase
MERYQIRGVSANKADIHQAILHVDKGIFPSAFCKVVADHLGGDPAYCNIMHADGTGSKASLAYVYYQETGDLSVFEGIARDTTVMNVDDLLCVGVYDHLLLSSSIGRHAKRIPSAIIRAIIEGHEKVATHFTALGISLVTTGGETADLGDLVRTLVVDSTITARWPRNRILTNERIRPGDIIIGLSSFGQTSYETQYNSGIGSNGLTSARHDLLHPDYGERFPESYDPEMSPEMAYAGPYRLNDSLEGTPLTIGQALLSPTRTYAPVLKDLLKTHFHKVSGVIHCTGGGQTKCLKFGQGIHYIKDRLFPIPPLFRTIQQVSQTSWQEMYEVFNMGHRMEILGPPDLLPVAKSIGEKYNLAVGQVGICEASSANNRLQIVSEVGSFDFE